MNSLYNQPAQAYRQYADYEYTLIAYRKAKEDRAIDLALNIRRANPNLASDFDLEDSIYKQRVLHTLPKFPAEGWDY